MEKFIFWLTYKIDGTAFVPIEAPNMMKAILKIYEVHDVAQKDINAILKQLPPEQPVVAKPKKHSRK